MTANSPRLFLAYIAPSNKVAFERFQRCVMTGISSVQIPRKLAAQSLAASVKHGHDERWHLWATGRGPVNQRYFEIASPGDEMIFIVGNRIVAVARVARTFDNRTLAQLVWGSDEYSLFYQFAKVQKVDIDREGLISGLGYKPGQKLRGLRVVSHDAAKRVQYKSDSAEALLERQGGNRTARRWNVNIGRISKGEWWVEDVINGVQVGWILKKPEGWIVTNAEFEPKAPPFRRLREARDLAEDLLQDECGQGNSGP